MVTKGACVVVMITTDDSHLVPVHPVGHEQNTFTELINKHWPPLRQTVEVPAGQAITGGLVTMIAVVVANWNISQ